MIAYGPDPVLSPAAKRLLRALLPGTPAKSTENAVAYVTVPLLNILSETVPVGAPSEPVSVTVMLGNVPREKLYALAALEAEAGQ